MCPRLHVRRRIEPFDADAQPAVLSAERQVARGPDGAHAGNRRESLFDLIEGGEALLVAAVASARQRHERCQHTIGRETGLRVKQRLETAEGQASADQQHRRQRDLTHDERHTQTTAHQTAGSRAFLQHVVKILAGEMPGGKEPEQEAGRDRQYERKCQDAQVESELPQTDHRQGLGRQLAQPLNPPIRDDQASKATDHSEDQALGQRLAGEPRAARAERSTYGHLAPAPGRLCQKQAGDVDAGNEQDECHGSEEQQQSTAKAPVLLASALDRAGDLVAER